MRTEDAVLGALENLRAHKLRSALTMLGMMFGVGAVIAMLAIGAGAERQALELIAHLGIHNIVIRDKSPDGEELQKVRKKSLGLSPRDVAAIEEADIGIARVVPRLKLKAQEAISGARKVPAKIFGVSRSHRQAANLVLQEGRFFDALDEEEHGQVCVIGSKIRQVLFGAQPAIGKPLRVADVWLTVVGVLAPESSSGVALEGISVGTSASEIYLPATTGLAKFERDPISSPFEQIIVQLEENADPRQSALILDSLLDRLHGGSKDYELVVPERLLEQNQETQRIFNVVMGCIAGISLLVGGIGIMNIMLASVLEQTREIGVRRAVGALRKDIRFQFLVEALAISLLGGIAGIVAGVGIAKAVANYAHWPTVVTMISVVIATGVSSAVGLISGIYPAIRASQLDPIEALHHQ
ncbi:MAG: ABC transporter permease [Polyangiaceae bacterium]|nr:ABC transporter permease [Polyangiaceae bacterium]